MVPTIGLPVFDDRLTAAMLRVESVALSGRPTRVSCGCDWYERDLGLWIAGGRFIADFNGVFGEADLVLTGIGDGVLEALVVGNGAFDRIDSLLSPGGVCGGVLEIILSRLLISRCIGGGVLCWRSRANCGGEGGAM